MCKRHDAFFKVTHSKDRATCQGRSPPSISSAEPQGIPGHRGRNSCVSPCFDVLHIPRGSKLTMLKARRVQVSLAVLQPKPKAPGPQVQEQTPRSWINLGGWVSNDNALSPAHRCSFRLFPFCLSVFPASCQLPATSFFTTSPLILQIIPTAQSLLWNSCSSHFPAAFFSFHFLNDHFHFPAPSP